MPKKGGTKKKRTCTALHFVLGGKKRLFKGALGDEVNQRFAGKKKPETFKKKIGESKRTRVDLSGRGCRGKCPK